METVQSSQARQNVERAIGLAQSEFSIPPLVEWNDVVTARPDEKCIMTYVSEFVWCSLRFVVVVVFVKITGCF
jgi:hypothetical protein